MLLIGVSACTTADPRSAATPTVPYTSATGTAASPDSSGTTLPRPGGKKRAVVPRPDHVVVVMLENEQRSSIIGSRHAPYLNRLAARGANLTHSYGLTHPSQPNYLALFSGSTQGVTSDACPQRFPKTENLGHQLRAAGFSFAGYAESLPKVGFPDARRVATSASTTRGLTHQPAGQRQPTVQLLPTRLSQTADRVVCQPEHVPQHARLLRPHW
jgi:hypothetical protein